MKKIVLAALLSLLSTNVFAIETVVADETVVTASRIPQLQRTIIADTTVITSGEIKRAGQSTLLELLQTQPGVEITTNGGIGKTSGLFLRGTNPGHVVVLIDGMRVNSATAGTTTFENLPLAQIERIEILRGPASSLYGADAIGGVIQIFTKKGKGKPHVYAGAGYGSYDTKTAEAGIRGQTNDISFALNVSSLDTDSFSAFRTSNSQFRDRDCYRNLAASGSLSYQIAQGHDVGFQFLSSEGHSLFDSRFNMTDFSDNTDMTQLSYALTSHNQFTADWRSTLRLGEGIDESANKLEFGRTFFRTKQRQYTWQNDLNLPQGILTLLYERLEERVSSSTDFDQDERNNDGYFLGYLLDTGPHSFQASLRSDHNSSFGTNDTGNLGYGFSFAQHWRATVSYGTAFKAPTFNDLYFPGFSNPDLKPEKSRNLEASLRYEMQRGELSLTAYENRIRDLIALDFLNAPFIFNVNKARIQGLTLAASTRLNAWHLKGSIDIQSPRDEATDNLLVRRANRHASVNLSRNWGDWHLGTELIASSGRYNDAANTQRLAGYAIMNAMASYQINQDFKLQARVNNLFDKEYALAYDGDPTSGGFIYDNPGSNLFVSISYTPQND